MECPQCRQPVGVNGGGRHAPGCPNGYYGQRPVSHSNYPVQQYPPTQFVQSHQPLNGSSGGIGPVQLAAAGLPPRQMKVGLPAVQGSAVGITPQQLGLANPVGNSSASRVCIYCQVPFFGSGDDHLNVCPKVPKCQYCGFSCLDLNAHLQGECTRAPPTQSPKYPATGLTPTQLDSIPTYLYPGPAKLCSICNNFLIVNQSAKQLHCGHIYHQLCIDQALTQRAVCPENQCPL